MNKLFIIISCALLLQVNGQNCVDGNLSLTDGSTQEVDCSGGRTGKVVVTCSASKVSKNYAGCSCTDAKFCHGNGSVTSSSDGALENFHCQCQCNTTHTGNRCNTKMCTAFLCSSGYKLKANPHEIVGDSVSACCELDNNNLSCDQFTCPNAMTRVANASSVTGNDVTKCCVDTSNTPSATCDQFTCPNAMTKIANADSVTGNDVTKCCVATSNTPSATCDQFACANNSTLVADAANIVGNDQVTCCVAVATCSSITCPNGFQHKLVNTTTVTNPSVAICCEALTCDQFTCPNAMTRVANASSVTGNDVTKCCVATSNTPSATCDQFTCPNAMTKIANADSVTGNDATKCCVSPTASCTVSDSTAVAAVCLCGGATCPVNSYCFSTPSATAGINTLKCSANKKCDVSDTTALPADCFCGSSSMCQSGQYCYYGTNVSGANTVTHSPTCHANKRKPLCLMDGMTATSEECDCGGTTCAANKYCVYTLNIVSGTNHTTEISCADVPKCSYSPTTATGEECLCESATERCSATEYCYHATVAATNSGTTAASFTSAKCHEKPQLYNCPSNPDVKVPNMCLCGGTECADYCYMSATSSGTNVLMCMNNARPKPCQVSMDTANAASCDCGGTICAANEFCLPVFNASGTAAAVNTTQCSTSPMCKIDPKNALGADCLCHQTKCSVGEYCYHNHATATGATPTTNAASHYPTCQTQAQVSECMYDPSKQLTAACSCGGTQCPAAKYCYVPNYTSGTAMQPVCRDNAKGVSAMNVSQCKTMAAPFSVNGSTGKVNVVTCNFGTGHELYLQARKLKLGGFRPPKDTMNDNRNTHYDDSHYLDADRNIEGDPKWFSDLVSVNDQVETQSSSSTGGSPNGSAGGRRLDMDMTTNGTGMNMPSASTNDTFNVQVPFYFDEGWTNDAAHRFKSTLTETELQTALDSLAASDLTGTNSVWSDHSWNWHGREASDNPSLHLTRTWSKNAVVRCNGKELFSQELASFPTHYMFAIPPTALPMQSLFREFGAKAAVQPFLSAHVSFAFFTEAAYGGKDLTDVKITDQEWKKCVKDGTATFHLLNNYGANSSTGANGNANHTKPPMNMNNSSMSGGNHSPMNMDSGNDHFNTMNPTEYTHGQNPYGGSNEPQPMYKFVDVEGNDLTTPAGGSIISQQQFDCSDVDAAKIVAQYEELVNAMSAASTRKENEAAELAFNVLSGSPSYLGCMELLNGLITKTKYEAELKDSKTCTVGITSPTWLTDACCNPAKKWDSCCAPSNRKAIVESCTLESCPQTNSCTTVGSTECQCTDVGSHNCQITESGKTNAQNECHAPDAAILAAKTYGGKIFEQNHPDEGCDAPVERLGGRALRDEAMRFTQSCSEAVRWGKTRDGEHTCNDDNECYTGKCESDAKGEGSTAGANGDGNKRCAQATGGEMLEPLFHCWMDKAPSKIWARIAATIGFYASDVNRDSDLSDCAVVTTGTECDPLGPTDANGAYTFQCDLDTHKGWGAQRKRTDGAGVGGKLSPAQLQKCALELFRKKLTRPNCEGEFASQGWCTVQLDKNQCERLQVTEKWEDTHVLWVEDSSGNGWCKLKDLGRFQYKYDTKQTYSWNNDYHSFVSRLPDADANKMCQRIVNDLGGACVVEGATGRQHRMNAPPGQGYCVRYYGGDYVSGRLYGFKDRASCESHGSCKTNRNYHKDGKIPIADAVSRCGKASDFSANIWNECSGPGRTWVTYSGGEFHRLAGRLIHDPTGENDPVYYPGSETKCEAEKVCSWDPWGGRASTTEQCLNKRGGVSTPGTAAALADAAGANHYCAVNHWLDHWYEEMDLPTCYVLPKVSKWGYLEGGSRAVDEETCLSESGDGGSLGQATWNKDGDSWQHKCIRIGEQFDTLEECMPTTICPKVEMPANRWQMDVVSGDGGCSRAVCYDNTTKAVCTGKWAQKWANGNGLCLYESFATKQDCLAAGHKWWEGRAFHLPRNDTQAKCEAGYCASDRRKSTCTDAPNHVCSLPCEKCVAHEWDRKNKAMCVSQLIHGDNADLDAILNGNVTGGRKLTSKRLRGLQDSDSDTGSGNASSTSGGTASDTSSDSTSEPNTTSGNASSTNGGTASDTSSDSTSEPNTTSGTPSNPDEYRPDNLGTPSSTSGTASDTSSDSTSKPNTTSGATSGNASSTNDGTASDNCCKALTLSCMSCAAGMTEEAYCNEYPSTVGCEEKGSTASSTTSIPRTFATHEEKMKAACEMLTGYEWTEFKDNSGEEWRNNGTATYTGWCVYKAFDGDEATCPATDNFYMSCAYKAGKQERGKSQCFPGCVVEGPETWEECRDVNNNYEFDWASQQCMAYGGYTNSSGNFVAFADSRHPTAAECAMVNKGKTVGPTTAWEIRLEKTLNCRWSTWEQCDTETKCTSQGRCDDWPARGRCIKPFEYYTHGPRAGRKKPCYDWRRNRGGNYNTHNPDHLWDAGAFGCASGKLNTKAKCDARKSDGYVWHRAAKTAAECAGTTGTYGQTHGGVCIDTSMDSWNPEVFGGITTQAVCESSACNVPGEPKTHDWRQKAKWRDGKWTKYTPKIIKGKWKKREMQNRNTWRLDAVNEHSINAVPMQAVSLLFDQVYQDQITCKMGPTINALKKIGLACGPAPTVTTAATGSTEETSSGGTVATCNATPGMYCPTGSDTGVPCPVGTYCPSAGMTTPINCLADVFCPASSIQPPTPKVTVQTKKIPCDEVANVCMDSTGLSVCCNGSGITCAEPETYHTITVGADWTRSDATKELLVLDTPTGYDKSKGFGKGMVLKFESDGTIVGTITDSDTYSMTACVTQPCTEEKLYMIFDSEISVATIPKDTVLYADSLLCTVTLEEQEVESGLTTTNATRNRRLSAVPNELASCKDELFVSDGNGGIIGQALWDSSGMLSVSGAELCVRSNVANVCDVFTVVDLAPLDKAGVIQEPLGVSSQLTQDSKGRYCVNTGGNNSSLFPLKTAYTLVKVLPQGTAAIVPSAGSTVRVSSGATTSTGGTGSSSPGPTPTNTNTPTTSSGETPIVPEGTTSKPETGKTPPSTKEGGTDDGTDVNKHASSSSQLAVWKSLAAGMILLVSYVLV